MRGEFHGKKSVRLEKEIPTQGGINSTHFENLELAKEHPHC